METWVDSRGVKLAAEVVGDRVRTDRDPVAVAVEDDRRAVAFLDHVARDDRAVGVLDEHAIAQVVVQGIARHGEIEAVLAVQGVLVLLELVGRHDDVVAAEQVQPDLLVVGQQAADDAGILDREGRRLRQEIRLVQDDELRPPREPRPEARAERGQEIVFALLDRCPHKHGRLSQGIVHGGAVACPLHNWRISLIDGHALEQPLELVVRPALRSCASQAQGALLSCRPLPLP